MADATTPRQRVLVTTLARAKHDADQGGFKAPAIVAIGAIAALHDLLAPGLAPSGPTP